MMRRSSNPFAGFDEMFQRMSRQFEEMNRQFDSWGGSHGGFGGHDMAVDVAEHDDEVVVTADLPGFEKERIDVSVSERTLTIAVDREFESDREDEVYVHRERRHESMRRSIGLPADVDETDASATYTNGVLTVHLPKMHVEDDEDSHHIDVD